MRPRPRRALQAVLGLAAAVVLLVWGLPHFAKTTWSAVFAVVATVPWTTAVLFQGLMLVGLWSYTFTFTGSLPGLGHAKALILNLCGSSVSNLLPGGGAVGLAATYTIARSWGFDRRAISTSAIVTGVWNVLARIALPVIAIIVLWWGNTGLPPALSDAAVAASLTGTGVIAVFVAVIASERAAQLVGRGVDRLVAPFSRRRRSDRDMVVQDLVTDLRTRINDIVRHGWFSMTLGMVGFFGFYFVLFMLITRTTGVDAHLGILFGAFAISRVLTTVGVTPGGVGVTETATAAALVAWGADPAAATAAVVLFSVFTHVMEVPLGGLGWLAWSLSVKSPPGLDPAEPGGTRPGTGAQPDAGAETDDATSTA